MIREQIKKDLKEAIEKSGILKGNFLDNIEWLLETVNKNNFEDFADPISVGKLRPEVQGAIGAEDNLVYFKPRVYGKIRGWWKAYLGHLEIKPAHFFLLPLLIHHPWRVYQDKNHPHRVLFVVVWDHPTALVIEINCQGGRNEIVTFSLVREKDLRKLEKIWQTEKWTADEGTAISPILAHPAERGVAGCRFSGLRQKVQSHINTIEKECQVVGDIHLEHPASPEHGDYSSNAALVLHKEVQSSTLPAGRQEFKIKSCSSKLKVKAPQELAELIVRYFPKTDYLEKIEVALPGFINFYLKDSWVQSQVWRILEEQGKYGLAERLTSRRAEELIQLEFISANPTGPLHIGNARGGFAGDVLANVLEKVGYKVQREYYVNDKGGQVEKLAESVGAYCQHLQGLALQIPEGGYKGEYVRGIAEKAANKNLKSLEDLKSFAISEILQSIKKTLTRMGIKFDQFFSEVALYDSSQAQKAIDFLKTKDLTYEKDGAMWFKSSKFGDEKDRVLVKSDGEMTYLVSDIAYHLDKFEKRKFDRVILFWGADHHGYVPRFMAMMEAVGHKGKARVELLQLLKLSRGGKEVRMSKRAGEYVTVDDVLDEVGLDAARFHFLMQPLSTPMTLDLEKAKEQSEKNPVYYVQYAHARMHGILAKVQSSKFKVQNLSQISKLAHPTELSLIRQLIQFPEVVIDIAENHEVHRLPQYAIEIADAFHRFYENCRVLSDDPELTTARLGLVKATQIVLAETLSLMGISAPERM